MTLSIDYLIAGYWSKWTLSKWTQFVATIIATQVGKKGVHTITQALLCNNFQNKYGLFLCQKKNGSNFKTKLIHVQKKKHWFILSVE